VKQFVRVFWLRHYLRIDVILFLKLILKFHWIVTTNKCTKFMLYISLKTIFYSKTPKRLLNVSIAHCLSSSGSSCCSLLKSWNKIVHTLLFVIDVAAYLVFVYVLFQCREWTAVQIVFRLLYNTNLVYLFVLTIQWNFKMHGATIKLILKLFMSVH
jgi:hypothetical protein